MSNIDQNKSDYERLWDASKEKVLQGNIDLDPVPGGVSRRWGISIIAHLSGQVSKRLAQVAQSLAEHTGNEQIIYSGRNLHTTIRTIEFFRSQVERDDPKVVQYCSILQKVAKDFTSLPVSYCGLAGNTVGVLAQGCQDNNTLQRFRDRVHEELSRCNSLEGPEVEKVRTTVHASLIVFTHPLRNPMALVEYIDDHMKTDYGVEKIKSLKVVRYIRTKRDVQLVTLGNATLG